MSGDLDKRVEILERSESKDQRTKEKVFTWNKVNEVWMNRKAAAEGEQLAGSQVKATITDLFKARFDVVAHLSPERHRLRFNGIEYNIHGFRELGRREFMQIKSEARGEMVEPSR